MKTIFMINIRQGLSGILYALLAIGLAGIPAVSNIDHEYRIQFSLESEHAVPAGDTG